MFGRLFIDGRARRAAVIFLGLLICSCTLLFAGVASADTAEAKKTFTTRCMACHTFGKGVKIGPDLKGVTQRRELAWIVKMVRSSSTMVGSDPIAVQLFEQFKQQRMPDWTDLSEDQVKDIMKWLTDNGPDQQDPDARSAELATAAEIETGRQLFHGAQPLSLGGLACASCHSIRDESGASGGGLASDLTAVYSQYQDIAMTVFLKRPCFQRLPESNLPAYLAPTESYALKAYLRSCALHNQPPDSSNRPTSAEQEGFHASKGVDGAVPGNGSSSGSGSAAPPASAGQRVTWTPGVTGARIGGHRSAAVPNELLFLVFPYLALAILILGLGIRHALARRRPEAIRPAAEAAWRLFRGTAAWRIGLAITAILHLVCLAVPGAIRGWNGAPLRLYLLEGTGFVFGVVALIGLVQLMWRHVGRSIAATQSRLTEIADYALLSVLCAAAVSGLATAVLYRWGSSWAIGTLTPYLWSLGKGEPAIELVEQMPFLIRLHVFSWFAVVAVVPFTSAAMILVAAGDRVVLASGRPITAAAQAGRRVLGKLSPARWLWPEEDLPGDGGDAHHPS
jgi:nitrate reductase gamma subunit